MNLRLSTMVISSFLCLSLIVQAGEYKKHGGNLESLLLKIQTKEDSIKALGEELNRLSVIKGAEDKQNETRQKMIKEHEELVAAQKQFNEEANHVRFQHPEKGEDFNFSIEDQQVKTMKEFEEEMGIDGRLNTLKSKVNKVYSVTSSQPSDSKVKSKKSKQNQNSDSKSLEESPTQRPKVRY
jgi:hypothetical protein